MLPDAAICCRMLPYAAWAADLSKPILDACPKPFNFWQISWTVIFRHVVPKIYLGPFGPLVGPLGSYA